MSLPCGGYSQPNIQRTNAQKHQKTNLKTKSWPFKEKTRKSKRNQPSLSMTKCQQVLVHKSKTL